ncbi:MAG TPA: hypothetical protein VIU12_24025 [Chryseolinea sp.]
MKKGVFVFIFLVQTSSLFGQENNLHQILRTILYQPEVFDKVFFEYRGSKITFMEGYEPGMHGAFILPDTTIQHEFPNVLDLVGTSHGTEKYFMTITFLSNPNGNVYITSHIADPGIRLYIDFDRISIDKEKAIVANKL